jgi:FkbM family methyltransferase
MSQIHSNHIGNYFVPLNIKNGTCVDIGGNTGQFSLKYKDFFKQIHIYEPQQECYEIIKKNINGYDNIKLYGEAVFHTSNMAINLVSHTNLDSGSVAIMDDIITVKEWTINIVDSNCKTISLEDIIQRMGGYIDYMKIDCENSEYYLLMNKDLSKIKYIGVELHWQMGKDNFDNLVNHILKYFNNKHNADLNYPVGSNIEVFFQSKFL